MTETPEELFYADGWRVRASWVLAVLVPISVFGNLYRFHQPSWGVLALLVNLSMVAVWFCVLWGLVHRRRPVVSIGGGIVEFGSIFRFARKPFVRIADIVRVEDERGQLRVHVESGTVVVIRMPELSRPSREAVRDAIERKRREARQ